MLENPQNNYLITKDAVSRLLHEYCLDKIEKASEYDDSYKKLWQEIDAYIQGGGKRIRAYLVLLTYQAYGGKIVESVLPIAAAWELLHSSLLIHDDIIDRDAVRHGKLNIAGVYKKHYNDQKIKDAHHFADSTAMLAGDLLLSSAYEILLRAEVESERKVSASALLSNALFGVAGGELMDMEIVLKNIASADALRIAQYKTAEYTCEYPLLCGAGLADAPDGEVTILRRLALALGIGYQLVDDILGVFGDENTTGKSVSGDIREKKRTVLLQKTYQLLKAKERRGLESIMQKTEELQSGEIDLIRSFMEQSGAKKVVLAQIAEYRNEALSLVDMMAIDSMYKAQYKWLVEKLLDRKF